MIKHSRGKGRAFSWRKKSEKALILSGHQMWISSPENMKDGRYAELM
jgi:hypothetical protein